MCSESANSAEAKNVTRKWLRILIQISGLILIVCLVAPKMLWIHSLVCVSRYAKCRKNRPVTLWEMLINHIFRNNEERGKVIQNPSATKADQFFRLVGPIIMPTMVPFERLGAVFYSPSIVTMAIFLTVCKIFIINVQHDLENWVRGCSRSLKCQVSMNSADYFRSKPARRMNDRITGEQKPSIA